MEQMEIRQKISNHPTLTDLERDVVVYRCADNMDVQQMPISARIEHFKDVDGRSLEIVFNLIYKT